MNQSFDLVDGPSQVLTLPLRGETEEEVSESNPELDAAQKTEFSLYFGRVTPFFEDQLPVVFQAHRKTTAGQLADAF